MNTILETALVAIVSFHATAARAGQIADFRSVELRGQVEATLMPGSEPGLTLEGDSSAVAAATTEVGNGRLVVTARRGFWFKRPIRAVITYKELSSIRIADGVEAVLEGVSSPRLRLELSGAASLKAQGAVESCELWMKDAARAKLDQLKSRSAFIRLEDAADAVVAPSEQLRGFLAGASSLDYLGSRATAYVDSTDGARIHYGSE